MSMCLVCNDLHHLFFPMLKMIRTIAPLFSSGYTAILHDFSKIPERACKMIFSGFFKLTNSIKIQLVSFWYLKLVQIACLPKHEDVQLTISWGHVLTTKPPGCSGMKLMFSLRKTEDDLPSRHTMAPKGEDCPR